MEDLAGELVQLRGPLGTGERNKPVRGWAATGEQLAEALEKAAGKELADRLRRAQELRHKVVHGIFLDFGGLSEDGHPDWVSMKRKLAKNEPPAVEVANWKVGGLDALITELAKIEDLLDNEISYAMGLKKRTATVQG